MSGFTYYVHCPSCGATSAAIPFGRMPGDPEEIRLPAANLSRRALDVVVILADDTTNQIPLAELASRRTTDSLRVAAPAPISDRLELLPPLPCPRCGTMLVEATWGYPDLEHRRATLDDIVAATRALADATVAFTTPDGAFDVQCTGSDGTTDWYVRLRADAGDLQGVVADLVARLVAMGSACTPPRIRTRTARWTETLAPRSAGDRSRT